MSLQLAFDKWKARCLIDYKWLINDDQRRLTNTRYADDIFVYAKSALELRDMVESLMIELKAIDLNASKTNVLTTNVFYMSSA